MRLRVILASLAAASLCLAQGPAPAPVKLDSILGVKLGDTLDQAREKLKGLGTYGGQPSKKGAYKEAWSLNGTPFRSLAYKADKKGKIVWITGWLRPGSEMSFDDLGERAAASGYAEREAIWNGTGPAGDFRLVGKGGGGKVSVVYLLLLETKPLE